MRVIGLALIVCALLPRCTPAMAQQPTPIIFDTDIGDDIDDTLALALALQSKELDIRAITTVIDDPERRARLTWKQLGIYGRRDIPVAAGAAEPLLDPIRTTRARQFEVLTDADVPPPGPRRRASELIIETLLAAPRKLTVVPVGPLTNIALALKTEPRIKEKIERIVLMGGAFGLLRSEYNIQRDRAAAQIVFSSGVPITAVGLDVTLKCKLQGSDMEKLRAAANPASKFMVRLIELWQGEHSGQYPTLHDPLAVAATFQPALIETQLGRVEVETSSPLTFGMTLFTPAERVRKDGRATTLVARDVEVRRFLDLFVDRLAAPARK